MSSKKILLVIAEGISDKEALGYILSNLFANEIVNIQITNDDITTRKGCSPSNIVNKIVETIKAFSGSIYKAKDFSEIVHIVDMDGAFIPDNNIQEDNSFENPYYDIDKIVTKDVEGIKKRNQQKRDNINKLLTVNKVWSTIPYSTYFFSSNLDHVLYGEANLEKEKKVSKAREFSAKYFENCEKFIEFVSSLCIYKGDDYNKTWEKIRVNTESLKRNTNFNLLFTSPKFDNSYYLKLNNSGHLT